MSNQKKSKSLKDRADQIGQNDQSNDNNQGDQCEHSVESYCLQALEHFLKMEKKVDSLLPDLMQLTQSLRRISESWREFKKAH